MVVIQQGINGLLANWWGDERINTSHEVANPADDETKHGPLLTWLKETHQAEGMPTGGSFLKALKKYENPTKEQAKGPIIQVVNSGDAGGRGFQYCLGEGKAVDFYTLSTLRKRCSEWRKKGKQTEQKTSQAKIQARNNPKIK